MTPADKRLVKAAKEAVAFMNGTADLSKYRIHTPAEINARAIRAKLKLTQAQFAKRFHLDLATLRDWEQGRRFPTGPASVLLQVIAREPEAVQRALGKRKVPARAKREAQGT